MTEIDPKADMQNDVRRPLEARLRLSSEEPQHRAAVAVVPVGQNPEKRTSQFRNNVVLPCKRHKKKKEQK